MTKILLVEDDKSLREIYGVRLLAEGYDIVSAGDGEEALAMAIKERPQLIVSDVMMPKISGFDMLDILRSTSETKDIKVIMMTALSSEDQRARGEALGADRYLVKSQVGIEDVVRTVHEVLADAPVSGGANPTPVAPPAAPSPRPAAPTIPPRPSNSPAPAAPAQPVADTPSPAPVQPSQPVPPASDTASAAAAPSSLPQPTAPFSTSRPGNLGDRVIHPLPQDPTNQPDVGSLMDQELGRDNDGQPSTAPVAPDPTPATPPAEPITASTPLPPAPPAPSIPSVPSTSPADTSADQSAPHGAIAYEETPPADSDTPARPAPTAATDLPSSQPPAAPQL